MITILSFIMSSLGSINSNNNSEAVRQTTNNPNMSTKEEAEIRSDDKVESNMEIKESGKSDSAKKEKSTGFDEFFEQTRNIFSS